MPDDDKKRMREVFELMGRLHMFRTFGGRAPQAFQNGVNYYQTQLMEALIKQVGGWRQLAVALPDQELGEEATKILDGFKQWLSQQFSDQPFKDLGN